MRARLGHGVGEDTETFLKHQAADESDDDPLAKLREFGVDSAEDVSDEGTPCPDCAGTRLNRVGRAVKLMMRGKQPALSLPALLAFTPQPLLAQERVRYVGEPVAFIVAETVNQAKDAAELIEVEYDPLPAVVTPEGALAKGAPAVWDNNPGNEAFCHEAGDKAATDAAFAKAHKVAKLDVTNNRLIPNAMEPRAAIAE